MDARELLETYADNWRLIVAQEETLKELQEKAVSVGGFDYGVERTKSNPPTTAPFEKYSINWIVLYEKANAKLEQFLQQKEFTEYLVDKIENGSAKAVLQERYFNLKDWKAIMQSLKLKERTMFNLHAKGLIDLQKIIDKELKQ